jgi:hypothetical protein
VRLTVVSIRVITPSKSWDKISIRGEGYDTPGITVAATIAKQQLTMYFGSLNEFHASWVCIMNIVRFEFQIQTLFFLFKPSLFGTYL